MIHIISCQLRLVLLTVPPEGSVQSTYICDLLDVWDIILLLGNIFEILDCAAGISARVAPSAVDRVKGTMH